MVQLADIQPDLELGQPFVVEVDEAAARRTLRDQIARLERQLSECLATAFADQGSPHASPAPAVERPRTGARLLGLGELEALRDDLAERLHEARDTLGRRADEQDRARVLLERMRLDPEGHKWVRVTHADLGEPGCWSWHVRPRLGIVGLFMGWWQVKLSSGCPLAT